MGSAEALASVRGRAMAARAHAGDRWRTTAGIAGFDDVDTSAARFATAGRLTVNFHPDRRARSGLPVAAALLVDGRYRSQWGTGISNGSRSAVRGGHRDRFEHVYFDGAYDSADPEVDEFPIYGAVDLLFDPHGGSPAFGSGYLVVRDHVRSRTTVCLGDSHTAPADVGTFDAPWSVLAGLAEQAAVSALLGRRLGPGVLAAALEGRFRSSSPGRCLDGYVEAQIHGGVDLAADVESAVLDPSFRGSDVERHLREAGDRFGFEVGWHRGSVLDVGDVPDEFPGPEVVALARLVPLARLVAGDGGRIDAAALGRWVAARATPAMRSGGDPPDSDLQQVKYLWQTLLACGRDDDQVS